MQHRLVQKNHIWVLERLYHHFLPFEKMLRRTWKVWIQKLLLKLKFGTVYVLEFRLNLFLFKPSNRLSHTHHLIVIFPYETCIIERTYKFVIFWNYFNVSLEDLWSAATKGRLSYKFVQVLLRPKRLIYSEKLYAFLIFLLF